MQRSEPSGVDHRDGLHAGDGVRGVVAQGVEYSLRRSDTRGLDDRQVGLKLLLELMEGAHQIHTDLTADTSCRDLLDLEITDTKHLAIDAHLADLVHDHTESPSVFRGPPGDGKDQGGLARAQEAGEEEQPHAR